MISKKGLEAYLVRWMTAGLLTPEQCERIRQFEGVESQGREQRMLLGLGALAALSIGFGIISVIAANWDQIGGGIKLFCYFSLLLALSFSLSRIDRYVGFVAETLSVVFLFFLLAGIGLVAQIYHLPSDGWRGLALWSCLGLAPTLVLGREKMAQLWLLSYLAAWIAWIGHTGSEMGLRLDLFFLHWALIGFAIFPQSRLKLPSILQPGLRSLSLGLVLLVYPYFLVSGFGPWEQRPWFLWGLIVLASWMWWPWYARELSSWQRGLMALGLLAFSLRCFLIFWQQGEWLKHWPNFVEALAVVLQGTTMAILALQYEEERWFQGLCLLMALRVFWLFLSLFGSLMMSGTGMILMGLGILLLLRFWHKHRFQIEGKLRAWGQG